MELQGFLISIHTPNENCLEVEVDTSHLKWDDYRGLVEALEDRLHEIDREYSARSKLVRGRTLKARYRRVAVDDRRRRLRFSPLPSRYTNLIKNLRNYVYGSLIPSTCLCLEKVASRKLYFLPKGIAPCLLETVDKINTETLAKVNEEIEEFTRGKEYFGLIQLLHGHGLDPSVLSQASFAIRDFAVDILPVDFGYSIDMDDYYAQLARMEHRRGLEALRRQIERKHMEYVSDVIRDIMSRLAPIIAAKSYRGMRIKQKLSKLIDICEGAGLESISERILRPLLEICSARTYRRQTLIERHFGTENLQEGVENAMRELTLNFWRVEGSEAE